MTPETSKTVNTIRNSGSRLLNLINDILDAAALRKVRACRAAAWHGAAAPPVDAGLRPRRPRRAQHQCPPFADSPAGSPACSLGHLLTLD